MKFYLVEFGAGVQVKRYERDMITKGSKFSDFGLEKHGIHV